MRPNGEPYTRTPCLDESQVCLEASITPQHRMACEVWRSHCCHPARRLPTITAATKCGHVICHRLSSRASRDVKAMEAALDLRAARYGCADFTPSGELADMYAVFTFDPHLTHT